MIRAGGVSPKQLARALDVSEASVKRWVDRGLIAGTRTAGGHRRLPIAAIVEFLRSTGRAVLRPEILGLTCAAGTGEITLAHARAELQAALEAGDEERARARIVDLYLARHPLSEIGDRVIAGTFRELGCRWQHGELEVYQERHAVEICTRVLIELRGALPPPHPDAPRAIGSTLASDPYSLASLLAELSLRERGWQADFLGIGLPASTIAAAIAQIRPRLVWLSVSAPPRAIADFPEQCAILYEAALREGAAVVVGGRGLTPAVRQQIQFSAHCDSLCQLVEFARTLYPAPSSSIDSPPPTHASSRQPRPKRPTHLERLR